MSIPTLVNTATSRWSGHPSLQPAPPRCVYFFLYRSWKRLCCCQQLQSWFKPRRSCATKEKKFFADEIKDREFFGSIFNEIYIVLCTEFYRDTLLILAKSGTRIKSGVFFGSMSRGLRQRGRLSSSASPTSSANPTQVILLLQCFAYIDFYISLSLNCTYEPWGGSLQWRNSISRFVYNFHFLIGEIN